MDISMDIHRKSVDYGYGYGWDRKFYIHGKPAFCAFWTARHRLTWLQTCDVCPTCRQDDVCGPQTHQLGVPHAVAVRNCWWPSLRCRWCSAMEQFTTGRCRIQYTVTVPPSTENISVQTVLPFCAFVVTNTFICGPSSFFYSGHVKNL